VVIRLRGLNWSQPARPLTVGYLLRVNGSRFAWYRLLTASSDHELGNLAAAMEVIFGQDDGS
jgi:hypothetical protein